MTKTQIRRNIKSNAKRMLKGSFGTAVLIILTYFLVLFGTSFLTSAVMNTLGLNTVNSDALYSAQWQNSFSAADVWLAFDPMNYFISLGLSFVSMLITIPLSFGIMEWFIRLSEGTKKPLSSVFDWFSTARLYFKSVGISLNVMVRTTLYFGLPTGLSAVGLFALGTYMETTKGDNKQTALLLFLGGLLLFAAVVITLSIFVYRYALTTYLCVRFPEAKMRSVIRESIAMMKGHKAELFVFGLSFLPWLLLSVFSFGLLLLWLMPYMMAATTIFCNYVYDVAKAAGVGSSEFPPYAALTSTDTPSAATQSEVRFIEGETKQEQPTWEQLIEKRDDSGENTDTQ